MHYFFTGIGHFSSLSTRWATRPWLSWNGAAAQASLERTALMGLRLSQRAGCPRLRALFKDPGLHSRVSPTVTPTFLQITHSSLGQAWSRPNTSLSQTADPSRLDTCRLEIQKQATVHQMDSLIKSFKYSVLKSHTATLCVSFCGLIECVSSRSKNEKLKKHFQSELAYTQHYMRKGHDLLWSGFCEHSFRR